MPLTTYKTSGHRELERALSELGKKSGFKALTGAMRDAARPIIKDARSRAPSKTGALRKGIKSEVFRGKGKSDSVATLHIGFNRKTAWYGQILERGAKKHSISSRGKNGKSTLKINGKFAKSVNHPGVKSKPMLRGSFDSKHKESLKILSTRLRERIILETIKKYGKGAR